MKKRTFIKKSAHIGSWHVLSGSRRFCSFADPLGLSYINGQNVTSRFGSFELSVPSEYKVDRSGASSALSGELVAGLVENGGKVDFCCINGR